MGRRAAGNTRSAVSDADYILDESVNIYGSARDLTFVMHGVKMYVYTYIEYTTCEYVYTHLHKHTYIHTYIH